MANDSVPPSGALPAVAVVGLGLIGGSLALRLHRAGHPVTGWDPDAGTRAAARAAGLAVPETMAAAVTGPAPPAHADGPDVVVLAAPLPVVAAAVHDLAPLLGPGTLLTDVASVKAPVLAAVRATGLADRFVGGHPMAGTEHRGFGAADADLLAGAAWVLTLEPDTVLTPWLRIAALVTGLGARVVPLSAADHDDAVARVSHLPHLLAAATAVVAGRGGPAALTLAAGSFRDGTRVVGGSLELPTAMAVVNAGPLGTALAEVLIELGRDPAALLADGGGVRRNWPPETVAGPDLDTADPDLSGRLLELGRSGGWIEAVPGSRLSTRIPVTPAAEPRSTGEGPDGLR